MVVLDIVAATQRDGRQVPILLVGTETNLPWKHMVEEEPTMTPATDTIRVMTWSTEEKTSAKLTTRAEEEFVTTLAIDMTLVEACNLEEKTNAELACTTQPTMLSRL